MKKSELIGDKLFRTFLVALMIMLLPMVLHAQEDKEQFNSELERLVKTIKNQPKIAENDKHIQFPHVPEGYKLELAGSDCPQVISNKGSVFKPLVDVKVQLYYQLVDEASGHKADVPNLKVTVKGEHKPVEGSNTCPEIIPQLREWLGGKGYLTFQNEGKIKIEAKFYQQLEVAGGIFVEDLKALNYKYQLTKSNSDAAINLLLSDEYKALGEEGYHLSIDENITIKANTPKGVLMGTRTILQLLNQYGNELPVGQARDYPKYRRRGFMIDAGRKFFSIDYLRNYIKIMAYYKMNEFHIHLNDNGFKGFFDNDWNKTYAAFRLESDTYPGLTAKDGSYSKKEFTELQKLGMEYGVNVIPEIDVPAHSLAFTQYRPDLGSKEYGMDHLDINNPDTYTFLDALFDEYLSGDNPVFIGPDVHIGTDEYDKKEAESFRKFTDHYLKKVQSYGYRARLWGSLTHADGETPVTSDNVIMNAWYNGYADPQAMINQGFELISTSDRHLYIVPAAGYYFDYLNLDFLYKKWEPNMIGGDVFPFGHPQISGGMFAVWNDHVGNGISEKDVHHRSFPALQVLAQKMWQGSNQTYSFEQYQASAASLIEAPGLNMMGKIPHKGDKVISFDFTKSPDKDYSGNDYHVKANTNTKWKKNSGLQFTQESSIELPIEEIGYGYEVAFDIEFDKAQNYQTELFASDHAQLVIKPNNGKLQIGFKHEGYQFYFDELFDYNKRYTITIKGDNKSTRLMVDGLTADYLEPVEKRFIEDTGRERKMYIQKTLVYPLKRIGHFNGSLFRLIVKDFD